MKRLMMIFLAVGMMLGMSYNVEAEGNGACPSFLSKLEKTLVVEKIARAIKKVAAQKAKLSKERRSAVVALKKLQQKVRRLSKAIRSHNQTIKKLHTAARMSVKDCIKKMRATFGPKDSRSERQKWIGRCKSTYSSVRTKSSL